MIGKNQEIELLKAIRNGSENVQDYFRLGSIYLESGRYWQLLDIYTKAMKLNLSREELARIHYERGEALQLADRSEEAIDSFYKSLEIAPETESQDMIGLLGMVNYDLAILIDNKRKKTYHEEEAAKYFSSLLRMSSDHAVEYTALSHLADIYCRWEKYDMAIDHYKRAIAISSTIDDRTWAMVGLAITYSRCAMYMESEHYFKMALEEDVEFTGLSKIYFEYGKMLFDSNNFEESRTCFQRALGTKELDASLNENREYEIDIIWHLAVIQYELNDHEPAIKYFRMILEYISDSHVYYANCHLTLGHIYLAANDRIKARENYNKVLQAPSAGDDEIRMARKCLAMIRVDA